MVTDVDSVCTAEVMTAVLPAGVAVQFEALAPAKFTLRFCAVPQKFE